MYRRNTYIFFCFMIYSLNRNSMCLNTIKLVVCAQQHSNLPRLIELRWWCSDDTHTYMHVECVFQCKKNWVSQVNQSDRQITINKWPSGSNEGRIAAHLIETKPKSILKSCKLNHSKTHLRNRHQNGRWRKWA